MYVKVYMPSRISHERKEEKHFHVFTTRKKFVIISICEQLYFRLYEKVKEV